MTLTPRARRRARWTALAALLIAAGVLLAALPITPWIESLRGAIAELGVAGMALYALTFALAATLLVPASPFQLGAGLLFGLGPGIAVALAGGWTSIALAFFVGRHLARDRVQRLLDARPRARAIEEVISEGGWKMVVLLRLSPLLPFSLHNYAYGITRIPFWHYWPAACLAVAPGTIMWAYTGYLGAAATGSLTDGDASLWKWILRGVGLLATVAVTVLLARRAKAKLDDTDALADADADADADANADAADDDADAADADAPSSAQLWALTAAAAALLAAAVLGQIYRDTLADWLS